MKEVRFPYFRLAVIGAVRSLSDPRHQELRWGVWEEGVSYYEDFTMCIHALYDDFEALPDPWKAVPNILHAEEVPAFLVLGRVLDPMLRELGDRPDQDYMSDPRWPEVVRAAKVALVTMEAADRETL